MKKREPFCSGPCMAQRGSLAWRSCDRDCNFDDLDRGWITPYKDLPDGPTAQDETGRRRHAERSADAGMSEQKQTKGDPK